MKKIFKLIVIFHFIIILCSCSQFLDEYINDKSKKSDDKEMINYKSNNIDNNRIKQE